MSRPKKPDAEKVVRKTVSMPPRAWRAAKTKAVRRGFENSFSGYIAWLIKRDINGGVVREDG